MSQNKTECMVLFMRQGNLFPGKFVVHHGGELARGRRKTLRPLSKKRPIHFVLKSQRRIYETRQVVVAELQRQAEKFQIRIYDFAVASDHLHFVARVPSRTHYVKFIRALCGLLARKLGGRKLWALPPFSRVANWGREYAWLRNYLTKNREEATGRQPYEERKDRYQRFRGKPK
ncbi:MAG: transposase [Bdellovibrionota bacterium]